MSHGQLFSNGWTAVLAGAVLLGSAVMGRSQTPLVIDNLSDRSTHKGQVW
jgi:hypothetical protein